jgi:hypothetical protein
VTDRRSRVLSSILTLAALGNGMPIGLGIPGRTHLDTDGPFVARRREPPRQLQKPERTPAEIERRKKRKAQRRSRKGRK